MKRKRPAGNPTRQFLLETITTHLSAVVSTGNNAAGGAAVAIQQCLPVCDIADLMVIEHHLRTQAPLDGLRLCGIMDIATSLAMAGGIRWGQVSLQIPVSPESGGEETPPQPCGQSAASAGLPLLPSDGLN